LLGWFLVGGVVGVCLGVGGGGGGGGGGSVTSFQMAAILDFTENLKSSKNVTNWKVLILRKMA